MLKRFIRKQKVFKIIYNTYLRFRDELKFLFVPDIDTLSSEIVEMLQNTKRPSREDTVHANIARKVVSNYRAQKKVELQRAYQPGPTWIDVYRNSSYVNPDNPATDQDLMDALFLGARTGYLEGSNEFTIQLNWIRENYDVRNYSYLLLYAYRKLQTLAGDSLRYILSKIKTTSVGQPLFIYKDGFQLNTNILLMCYYLHRFITLTGLKEDQRFIWCDLGSGAGYMAKVIKNFFRNAVVILVDLPETLLFASYFNNMNFQSSKFLYYSDLKNISILDRKDIMKYDFIFLPHFAFNMLESNTVDICWNTMSLSEMPPEAIENYIRIIEKITSPKGYFYTVNRNIECKNRGGLDVPLDRFPFDQSLWEKISYNKIDKFIDTFHEYKGFCGELLLKKKELE